MMHAQRWERLSELFDELTTVTAADRESYLLNNCGHDVELRDELVSLLRMHDQVSGPLDVAPLFADDTDPDSGAADLPGTSVGSYRLLRPLGEGGMGNVWLAERSDGVLKRAIALKRPHASLSGSFADRLAHERDILASLEHPNIARLYDAGVSADGRPYLALEYVEGTPISDYCQAQRLSVRQRLELFLRVLEAVRFAHMHLVVHRDIKPSNILVAVDGQVRLLDFGIAKLLSHEGSNEPGTQFGSALTPDYASPEQIRGEAISTASDVYGLGVVLFEILTGVRPYRLPNKGNSAALADELDRIEVSLPSKVVSDPTLKRELQGDIDSIVEKALQRNLAHRYTMVDPLAADILRCLRDEPVSARRAGHSYRARKFLRRHRWQSASAATALIALVAGTGVALWQARAARLEATRAEQVKGFALSLLDSADSDAGAGVATTAVDLLQAARKRVEIELAGRPAVAAELMTAIGYGLIGQDRAEDAAGLLKGAIELSSQANGRDDSRTVDAEVVYGEALYNLGRNDEAIALLKSTIGRAQRVHDTHAEIDAWRWLSSAQIDAGQGDLAVASARAAVAVIASSGTSPDRRALLDAMQAHQSLANVLSNTRNPGVVEEARAALRYAAQLGNTLEPSAVLDARTLLGVGLIGEGQPVQGLRELKSAYADSRTIRGPDHLQSTISASLLGKSSLEAGDIPGALYAYQECFDSVMRQKSARAPFIVAQVNYGLAQALAAAHEHEKALPHFDEAAKLFAETSGPTAPLAMRSRSAHALSMALLGRLAESDREFANLATLPFVPADQSVHQGRLAVLRSLQGRHDEAVLLARQSAEGLKDFQSKSVRAQSLARLGSILLAANRADEATNPLQQSIDLFSDAQVPESPERAAAVATLNQTLESQHP